ncbi:MAG: hypothetical protein NZ954_08240 [Thermofilaceae archaeon]|nr:hypothetical protein [Thermofilaceae archaeon]MDW8004918.1 hypothetical protein [Thermofilaceae archaeon]
MSVRRNLPVMDIEAEEENRGVQAPATVTEYAPQPQPPPQPVQPPSTITLNGSTVLPIDTSLPVMDIEYTPPPSPTPSPGDWSTTLTYKQQLEAATSRDEVENILEMLRQRGYIVESRALYSEDDSGLWTERILVSEPKTGEWFVMDFLREGATSSILDVKVVGEGKFPVPPGHDIFLQLDECARTVLGEYKPVAPPKPEYTVKHYVKATRLSDGAWETQDIEVLPFEEFVKQYGLEKQPKGFQEMQYQLYLAKTIREKGFTHVYTKEGGLVEVPDPAEKMKLLPGDPLSAQFFGWHQAREEWARNVVQKAATPLEAAAKGFVSGFVGGLTFDLLKPFGSLPTPPEYPFKAPVEYGTKIEVPLKWVEEEKRRYGPAVTTAAAWTGAEMLGGYAGSTTLKAVIGKAAGIAFQKWKGVDVMEAARKYIAGEKLSPLERLKLEAWTHTPEKVWKVLSKATEKTVHMVPEEVVSSYAQVEEGGRAASVFHTRVSTWQEVPEEVAQLLKAKSTEVGFIPVKTASGRTVHVPWASEGLHGAFTGSERILVAGGKEAATGMRLAQTVSREPGLEFMLSKMKIPLTRGLAESKAGYVLGEAGEEGVRSLFFAGAGEEYSAAAKAVKVHGTVDVDDVLRTVLGGVPPSTGGFTGGVSLGGGGALKQGLKTVTGYKVTVPVATSVKPATEAVEKAAKAAAAVASISIAQPKTLEAVTVPVKTEEKEAKPVLQTVLVKEEKIQGLFTQPLPPPPAVSLKTEVRTREWGSRLPLLYVPPVPQLFEPRQVQTSLQVPKLSTIQVTSTDFPKLSTPRVTSTPVSPLTPPTLPKFPLPDFKLPGVAMERTRRGRVGEWWLVDWWKALFEGW